MPTSRLAALAAFLAASLPAAAIAPDEEAALVEGLRGGSHNIVLARGTTPAAIAQWKQAFQRLQILVGWIHASPDDVRTPAASLGYIEVRTSPDPADGPEVLRKMASREPPSGTNTIIVAPRSVIAQAFGAEGAALGEGEAIIFYAEGRGRSRKVGRVASAEWADIAERRRPK